MPRPVRFQRSLSAILLGLLIVGLTACGESDRQTRVGEFVWLDDPTPHAVRLVFEPHKTQTDGPRWNVEFHFSYGEGTYTYRGTLEGSLADGPLSGQVVSEDGAQTFQLTGIVENGRFTGRHEEIIPHRDPHPTGSLTFGPEP